MRITRRDLMRGAGSFVSAVLLGECAMTRDRRRGLASARAIKSVNLTDAGPLSGARLYEDVIAYYNLGEHRTATEADLATSQWLIGQLRATGLKATTQSFGLRQFFVHQTRLTVGDRNINAFPLWFPRGTGPSSINGPVTLLDKSRELRSAQGKIVLARFPFDTRSAVVSGSGHDEAILAASKAGASAVVAITEGSTREIIALNAVAGAEPWPIPVVLISPHDEGALMSAVRSGAKASLLMDGIDDRDARAKNVIARLDRGKELIVVSTPQSGWFRCAGERGPGIALFLGLARWASRRPSGASFLFVSTSGHELGGLGMRAFQKELAPPPDRVLCWIHLGAGIATYAWEETASGLKRLREPDSRRYLMTSPDLVPMLTATFAGLPGLTPVVDRAVGEFEFMIKAGYRTFGIAAGHRFHHTPADSPEMTGVEILAPVGTAFVKAIEALESSGVRT
jgi:hypothetical protein